MPWLREYLAAFLGDLYVPCHNCNPTRARPALDDVTRTVEQHSGVAANLGKTRVCRAGHRQVSRRGDPESVAEVTTSRQLAASSLWVQRILTARLEEESRLLRELQALPDMQSAWLLLLYCTNPLAYHYRFRVPVGWFGHYCSTWHDNNG